LKKSERKVYRVCWIEDDPAWAKTYVELLEDEDIEVEMTGSVARAVQLLSSDIYHLIIVDHELRGGTGLEVLEEVFKDTRIPRPVVLVSGRIESLPDPGEVQSKYLFMGVLEYRKKTELNGNFGVEMRNHIELFWQFDSEGEL
jgi:CheY-like chemotaxis protein